MQDVLDAIGRMQSGWNESTDLATMRADLEGLYLSYEGVAGSLLDARVINGVPVECVVAPGADTGKVAMLLHGGGFSMGSARSHRHLAQWISSTAGCAVWVPDYRLVPDHVYPAQLDDVFAVYEGLLQQGYTPRAIALMGDSAGAGLVLSLLGRLRDANAVTPGCACLMSPWLDLYCSGDSYQSLASVDPFATHEMAVAMGEAYVGQGGDRDDPLACPIKLDFSGLPPLLIQAGSREVFLDDARTAASAALAARVSVAFSEWEGMIHQWHLYAAVLPDARRAIEEQGDFLARHLG